MAARPHGLDQEFAESWTKGSRFAPRDLLTLAALGQLFEITLVDGTTLESVLKAVNNPQALLDLVTNEPGSLLFRSPDGWVKIPPGNPGQVLEYQSTQVIRWVTPAGGSGGSGVGYTTLRTDSQTTNNFTAGHVLQWQYVIDDPLGTFDPLLDDRIITVPPGVVRATPYGFLRMEGVAAGVGTMRLGRPINQNPDNDTQVDNHSTFNGNPNRIGTRVDTHNTWHSMHVTPGDTFQIDLLWTSDSVVEVVAGVFQIRWE